MWELINAPQTRIFGVAIALMVLLGVLEAASMLLGGFSDWLDGLLPESLLEMDADVPLGAEPPDPGVFIRFLSWLYVGKLPVLMVMVVFLCVFGLVGYGMQGLVHGLGGFWLPQWPAAALAWLLSLPLLRAVAAGLYRVIPKDETTAVAGDSLVGRVGVVVTGTAGRGKAAEVRVKDVHGQQHYVMAEADGETELPQGTLVLLVSHQGALFQAIENPNGSLAD